MKGIGDTEVRLGRNEDWKWRVLAIDPGDRHVGLAWFTRQGRETAEVAAVELVEWLRAMLRQAGEGAVVVVEDFVLYPHAAGAQSWQQLPTPEMIGQIGLVVADRGLRLVRQGANIKKPTRAQLRGRGVRQIGRGTHERDAELHLWHWTLQHQKESGVDPGWLRQHQQRNPT